MSSQKRARGWRILFSYALKYKQQIITLSAIAVVAAIIDGVMPFVVGRFFDAIINVSSTITLPFDLGTYPQWAFYLTIFGVAALVSDVVGWFSEKGRRRLGSYVAGDYPATIFEKIITLPASFHTSEKVGKISERIQRAGSGAINIMEILFIDLAPQFLSIVVGIIVMLFLNVPLTLILVTGIVLYVFTLFKIVPPLVKMQRKGQRRWGEAWGIAIDALSNVHQVKQATAEPYEQKQIRKGMVTRAAEYWYKIENIWAGISFYQRIIVTTTRIAIFGASVYFVMQGELTAGELVAFNGYAMMVFVPFARLGFSWQSIQNGLVGLEEVDRMTRIAPENTQKNKKSEKKKIEEMRGEVSFDQVYFRYKPKDPQVLNGITFRANPGETVALVGESGVGKSTTIELLSGYYFPTKGHVRVDGVSTKDIDLYDLRKHIAVVPQELVLFNDTILHNIRYGAFGASEAEVKAAAKKAHADLFIERFPQKYKQLVGERGVKLSVGQKQRIAIARAILRDPAILILDEPTSALDAQTEQLISESLDELMEGRTTFIIAHRLSTVRNADHILVFDKGQILEEGTHNELIKKKDGKYRHMYEFHIGLHE